MAPPAHPLDEKYYVRGETEAYGPYDGRTVKDMVEQGRLIPSTGLARVGATEWTEVKDHPYFGTLRRGGAAPTGAGYAAVAPAPMRLPGGPGAYQHPALQSVRYAGFWIRFVAYWIDGIILGIPFGIVFAIFLGGYFASLVASGNSGDTQAQAAAAIAAFTAMTGFIIFAIAANLLYHVLFLRSGWQATPGKRLLGLCVVTQTGQRLSGLHALGRTLAAYFISGSLTLDIGYMLAGWNSEKKALHDMICGTRVIYGKP
jgi:uncharacterized RDD family membrane protein YckC